MKIPRHRFGPVFIRGLLTGLLLGLVPLCAGAADRLVIGTSYKVLLSTPAQDGMLDRIAKAAFSRLGIEIELPYLPTERSISAANDGIHDGELNRIAGLEAIYPNLVRVDESMMDFDFVGFTRSAAVEGGRWQNLRPFQVGLIKGWKILEAEVGHFPQVTFFHSAASLFDGLAGGRVDVALYGRLIGYAVIDSLSIKGLRVIEPPFASRKMYMYLHRKHIGLVPAVADALRQIKRSGIYGRIVSDAVAPYENAVVHGTP